MKMVTWYTLSYRTQNRGEVTLYNLQRAGVSDIVAAQTRLGSTDFREQAQGHHYGQFEIQLLRAEKVVDRG